MFIVTGILSRVQSPEQNSPVMVMIQLSTGVVNVTQCIHHLASNWGNRVSGAFNVRILRLDRWKYLHK